MPIQPENNSFGMTYLPIQPAHIGVVDDDPFLLDLVSTVLINYGYRVSICGNTREFWQLWKKSQPDLIILDLNLPDGNGMDICRDLRAVSSVPILILTARSDEIERVVGLEMGADDYLVKPIFPRELVARVKTILRRANKLVIHPAPVKETPTNFHFSGWMLAPASRQLIAPDGTDATLSEGECRLLMLFLAHPQKILSREQIIEVAGVMDVDPLGRSVDNMVSRVRKRLRDTASQGRMIETVRKEGYRLLANVDTATHAFPLTCTRSQTVATLGFHALVLSRDEAIGFILETLLNYFGFHVAFQPFSNDALPALAKHEYALVLLDCDDSDAKQLALVKKIRAAAKGHPLVALQHVPEPEPNPQPVMEVDDFLATPIRFSGLHAMLTRQLPATTREVPAALSCMDLVLASELKNLAGKQGFLRFLHLLATQIASHRSALKQAALAPDHKAILRQARHLHNLAASVGAQRMVLATTDLLNHPGRGGKEFDTLVSMVDIACELTDTAITATRMLTQRESP
ncbi:MAG: response regulator [Magnetococcales bacterium]|nr:response regulator [Magnetococcales bacterium]